MEGDSAAALHTEAGGRPQLTISADRLYLYGKPVGELQGDGLRIGGTTYQVLVTPNPQPPARPGDREDRWLVEVRRGEQRIAGGRAMAMCLGGPRLVEGPAQELEVRRRVLYYLAWRQLLARAPQATRRPRPGKPTPPPL
jgi:hypothetical protein